MSWSFWNKLTDPAPQPALDRGVAQRRMVALAPPIISTASAHADAAGWRIRAEEAEKALTAECDAHADTIKLVERLRATPTPDDLWLEVRISEQGQRARKFARMYGRASATIGEQRDTIARIRAQREDAEHLVVALATALGCGPTPSASWLLDVAERAGQLLAVDAEQFRRKLLDAATDQAPAFRYCPRCGHDVDALPVRRICDECEHELDPADTITAAQLLPDGWQEAQGASDEALCWDEKGPLGPVCTRRHGHGVQHVGAAGREVYGVWLVDPAAADRDAELIERARVLGDEIGNSQLSSPVLLVDRDGDQWLPLADGRYVLDCIDLDIRDRPSVERGLGPVTEKAGA